MADGAPFTEVETGSGSGPGARSAPEAVWAAVRADYVAGMSAPEACRRHGVGLSALRARAGREGWRRRDLPWMPRTRLDPDDEGAELEARVEGDLDRVDLPELIWICHRRMIRAVMRGDAVEAMRWRRVHEAMEADQAEVVRFFEQQTTIARPLQDGPGYPDDPDDPDGVFPDRGDP
jgi:hypothetical protein